MKDEPWRPISESDAAHVLDEIEARGPRVVALSSHDSTQWSFDAFARRLGDRYRTLRVGEELRITAAGAQPPRPSEKIAQAKSRSTPLAVESRSTSPVWSSDRR